MRLRAEVIVGDCIESMRSMPESSVQCCVTSPPYWGLRDYGHDGQIGLEETPDAYVERMVEVFREVRRVLRDDGTLWLNLGDSYAGSGRGGNPPDSPHQKQATNRGSTSVSDYRDFHDGLVEAGAIGRKWVAPPVGLKPKDLVGIPWRVVFALQADGWWLRQDIIWHKPNPMPESVTDRCTKAHEYVFLLTKSARYYYDAEAVSEPACYADCGRPSKVKGEFVAKGEPLPGRVPFRAVTQTRNRRSVWTITTKPYSGAHFAVMPSDLVEPCVKAGSREGDTVLDPFAGSGTTLAVALDLGRHAVGCELNADYATLAEERIAAVRDKTALFDEVAG